MLKNLNDKILQWVDANNILNSKGEAFEWKEHEFLLEPLCDWHPRQAIRKSSQLGVSESIGILKSLYAAQELKYNIIYTLPTDQFLEKFVPSKLNPIIESNPNVFGDITGNISLKTVGDGYAKRFINLMGTFNTKGALKPEETSKGVMFTSDLNIHDEASRSDQFILNQLRSRLDNSLYKGRWLIDNPTYPLMGADKIYQKSDQCHWIIKCSRCGYKQYLEWARLDKVDFKSGSNHCYVDPEQKEFICGQCKKPIVDEDRLHGEWVPKYPTKSEDYRGYWMPQMVYVRHNVRTIIEKEDDTTIEPSYFHNFVIAKPYVSSDIRLNRKDIIENYEPDANDKLNNAMGVDQGVVKWYVIGNEQGIFKYGSTKSWDEIEQLKKLYNCKVVMDSLPSMRFPKYLIAKYRKDCYRAFYKPETDQAKIVQFGTKDDPNVVLIKREEAIDEIVNLFLDHKFPLQIPVVDLEQYINHWVNLVKIVETDRKGNDRYIWHSITGEDHLAHATLYFWVALARAKSGKVRIRDFSRQGEKNRKGVYVNPDGTITKNLFTEFMKKE